MQTIKSLQKLREQILVICSSPEPPSHIWMMLINGLDLSIQKKFLGGFKLKILINAA